MAGTLAARHGIRIRLEAGAFRGVVAIIELAATVVESPTRSDAVPAFGGTWAHAAGR